MEGIIPAGYLTILGAHGGAGKSGLAVSLAIHCAAGRPWGGLAVAQGRALIVSLEDAPAMVRRRLKLAAIDHDIAGSAVLDHVTLLDGSASDGALMLPGETRRDPPTTTEAYTQLRDAANGCALVIIDNASDAFAGDEIDRRQVRFFTRALSRLATETGAAVLLLNHVDKASAKGQGAGQNYSGSTAWHNGARSRLALIRGENGELILRHEKCNLGPLQADIPLCFSDYGTPMVDTSAAGTGGNAPDPLDLLPAFRAAHEAGLTVRASLESNQWCAQATLERLDEYPPSFRGKRGREAAAKAIIELRRQGRLVEEEFRTNGRNYRTRLVLKEHAAEAVPLSDLGDEGMKSAVCPLSPGDRDAAPDTSQCAVGTL